VEQRQRAVEGVELNRGFWNGKRVLITGNTGFKGAWLSLWLADTGANVIGYSLPAPTNPSLFDAARLSDVTNSIEGDVRDLDRLKRVIAREKPDVIFHLAAQSIVRESYSDPVTTYATNVMGTVHLLEAARGSSARAIVIVTSDKCYENKEWAWPYRENEPMGGRDPYSSSKGCAELVTAAYRASFFADGPAIASARAGNVIGGADWAKDRLVPDLVRAFERGEAAVIRNPLAIRPWQHVLEPLAGYVILAQTLYEKREGSEGWNFGPADTDVRPVEWIADTLVSLWGGGAQWTHDRAHHPHEAHTLTLDSSRARRILGWRPRLSLHDALEWIVEWHKEFVAAPSSARDLTLRQISRFEALAA
jgi:CDP-glucose 4,6-dehydratase